MDLPQPPQQPYANAPDVRVAHLRTIATWALGLGLLLYFFSPAKTLFLGMLVTGCIAAALHPLMHRLPGPKGLRAVIVGLTPIAVFIGAAMLVWWLLAKPIATQVNQWPAVQEELNQRLERWSEAFGLIEPLTMASLIQRSFRALTGGNPLSTAADTISSTLIALAFIFFGSIYLLVDSGRSIVRPVRAVLPDYRKPQFDAAVADLVPRLRGWVVATMISMTVIGATSCAAYWMVGLKLAIPVGVLTGLSEIVPTVGPALSFGLALMSAAGEGSEMVLWVTAAYAVVQTLESYVVTPMVMKGAVHMPPIITLFSVVLWGQVFGVGGLLLAIPINLVIWTFVDHFVVRPRSESVVTA